MIELAEYVAVEVLVDDVVPLAIGLREVGGVPEILVELAVSEASELSPDEQHAVEEQKEEHEVEHLLREHEFEQIDCVGALPVGR